MAANNYRAGAGGGPRILISNTDCFVRSGTEFQTNASLTNARQTTVSDPQVLGLDQAEPSLSQFWFAKEWCYLALEPHLSDRISRPKEHRSRRVNEWSHRRCCALKPNSLFTCSTNPSLPTAIDSDQLHEKTLACDNDG